MKPRAFISNDWIADPISDALISDGWDVVRGPRSDGKSAVEISPQDYPRYFANTDLIVVTPPFTSCDQKAIEMSPRLRAAFSTIIGVETIDVRAATNAGIVVGIGATPENVLGCSEATVALIGALSLDLLGKMALLRSGKPRPRNLNARMVKGKTVGLVGCGRIGSGVAERLRGWGVDVVAYDPGVEQFPDNVIPLPLEELLQTSDIVSLHLPLTPQTYRLIGAQQIAMMRDGAFLINLARGGIVDEVALFQALKSGKLKGAAVDCFEQEPLPMDSPLRTLDNLILTPHMAGHTQDALESLVPCAVESARRILKGEPPLYVKNPEVLAHWRERVTKLNA